MGVIAKAALGRGEGYLVHGFENSLAEVAAGELGVVRLDGFGDLSSDGHDGVEGGHGFLEDHGDVAAAVTAHSGFGEGEQGLAVEGDGAGDAHVGGDAGGEEAEDGEGGGGFSGARFADQAEGLAGVDLEGDGVDGALGAEGDGQIDNFEQRGGGHLVAILAWMGVVMACGGLSCAEQRLNCQTRLEDRARREIGMMTRKTMAVFAGMVLAGAGAVAQTHKVAKPETVVRAVGVYEWTGDIAKPTASRLIPVTLFIDGQLQDAGVYLARPVPLALLSGNFYELQQAGVAKGGLELAYAKHLQLTETATGATAYDDGWFGYGSYKAPAAAKKAPALRPSTTLSEVKSSKDSKDDGRPHFSNRSGGDQSGNGDGGSAAKDDSSTSADADRPTMKRRSGGSSGSDSGGSSGTSGSGTTGVDAGATPADDPDRPHLSKKTGTDSSPSTPAPDPGSGQSGDGSATGSSAGSGSAPTTAEGGSADDPDRPTLKRRSPEEIKKDRKKEDSASVSGVGSLNDDPNRPIIRRGKPTSAMNEDDLPKLMGLPADLQQMAAVSDAVNRPEHEFARPWADDAERSAILTKMEVIARAKLAEYGVAAASTAAPAPAAAPKPATTAAARRAAAAKKKAAAAAPVVPLQDEELKGYTLSYGGAATYVYTAHTAGGGAALDYVTVVAQADALGELKPAITSVTDATHLDRTPRMRLVDAVDAEASNRASLLFELRGQKSRQFALYSVIGARADQRFLSGTTQ